MVIEWKSMLFVVVILFLALMIIKFLSKKLNLNGEIKRKMFHITMGIVMLIFPYIFKSVWSVGILGVLAIIIMILLRNTKLKQILGNVLYDVERDSLGEIFFIISVFLIYYLSKGDKVEYSIPILILTFADSAAALIGKNYAKENLAKMNEDKKSIEGSLAFFIVAFMATLVPLLLWTSVGREEVLIISTIIGFNVSLVEMISHTGNDNLLIPLTSYAILATHISADLIVLRQDLVIIAILFVLVLIINKIKIWSKLALVELMVIGYLIISLYSWYAVIPPLIVLLTVMNFPRLKENEKSNMYDSRIIETNIIIGTAMCGIVAIVGYKKETFMIYATCYAMHLIINTYVRFRYFLKYKEFNCLLFSVVKGIGFVFIPSLIVQKFVFGEVSSLKMIIPMIIGMILSAFIIKFSKRNVKEEEICVDNGYLHMRIVLVITITLSLLQMLQFA